MNKKLSFLQSLFDLLNAGHITDKAIRELKRKEGDRICVTKFELREAAPELLDFAYKFDLVIDSLTAYKCTEPYEDFQYSFRRLKQHLDTSIDAFNRLEVTSEGKVDDWEDFKEKLDLSSTEIIYEQSLITLLTIFEAYITRILEWIFQQDESLRHKIRVNVDYDEVLENIDDIVPFLVVKNIDQIRGLERRVKTVNDKPIQIKVENKSENRIVKDAIAKRNILIHNKGIVNEIFLKKINKNDLSNFKVNNDYLIGDKVKINSHYYYKVQDAIQNLVKYIDDKVKEKYI